VVVNDAIVFVDCFNTNLGEGNSFISSILQAGKRRFRAIFLTTVTTFGGLIGLLFTRDMQAQFLKPMAVSLAIGLVFATVVTLLFIPTIISVLNDIRRLFYIIKNRRIPKPEEVEPVFSMLEQKRQLENSTL